MAVGLGTGFKVPAGQAGQVPGRGLLGEKGLPPSSPLLSLNSTAGLASHSPHKPYSQVLQEKRRASWGSDHVCSQLDQCSESRLKRRNSERCSRQSLCADMLVGGSRESTWLWGWSGGRVPAQPRACVCLYPTLGSVTLDATACRDHCKR